LREENTEGPGGEGNDYFGIVGGSVLKGGGAMGKRGGDQTFHHGLEKRRGQDARGGGGVFIPFEGVQNKGGIPDLGEPVWRKK